MLSAIGLLRSVVRRAVADWPVTLAAASLLLAATTVVAADALYADAVTLGGLREALTDAPPAERNILVSTRVAPDRADSLERAVEPAVSAAVASIGAAIVRQTDASWLESAAGGDEARISGLTAVEPLEDHASLVDGRWPRPGEQPFEATLPADAADALGLAVGDRVSLADRRDPSVGAEFELVGTWRPNGDDAFWAWVGERRSDSEEQGRQSLVVTGPDLIDNAVSAVAVAWWTLPAFERLGVD
ncbi:MAG: hypothetical protein M3295_05000, partial [Chloroflexota bacterium]|nr:hypothetical protein [Chloroflexota bacterium]